MCGRYVLTSTLQQVQEAWSARPEGTLDPSHNVCPSDRMPIVLEEADGRKIGIYQWGLIPSWSKSPKTNYSMINARSESLAEKSAWRNIYRAQRCVVPANGFYEWQKTAEGKVPYYITLMNSDLIPFAGLYEKWSSRGQSIQSFTIITTPANEKIAPLHGRMPAILLPEEVDSWLNPANTDPAAMQQLLHPYPNDAIRYHRVSTKVNNPKNNGAELTEPEEDLFS